MHSYNFLDALTYGENEAFVGEKNAFDELDSLFKVQDENPADDLFAVPAEQPVLDTLGLDDNQEVLSDALGDAPDLDTGGELYEFEFPLNAAEWPLTDSRSAFTRNKLVFAVRKVTALKALLKSLNSMTYAEHRALALGRATGLPANHPVRKAVADRLLTYGIMLPTGHVISMRQDWLIAGTQLDCSLQCSAKYPNHRKMATIVFNHGEGSTDDLLPSSFRSLSTWNSTEHNDVLVRDQLASRSITTADLESIAIDNYNDHNSKIIAYGANKNIKRVSRSIVEFCREVVSARNKDGGADFSKPATVAPIDSDMLARCKERAQELRRSIDKKEKARARAEMASQKKTTNKRTRKTVGKRKRAQSRPTVSASGDTLISTGVDTNNSRPTRSQTRKRRRRSQRAASGTTLISTALPPPPPPKATPRYVRLDQSTPGHTFFMDDEDYDNLDEPESTGTSDECPLADQTPEVQKALERIASVDMYEEDNAMRITSFSVNDAELDKAASMLAKNCTIESLHEKPPHELADVLVDCMAHKTLRRAQPQPTQIVLIMQGIDMAAFMAGRAKDRNAKVAHCFHEQRQMFDGQSNDLVVKSEALNGLTTLASLRHRDNFAQSTASLIFGMLCNGGQLPACDDVADPLALRVAAYQFGYSHSEIDAHISPASTDSAPIPPPAMTSELKV